MKNQKNKICPLMSRPNTLIFELHLHKVKCLEKECQFWTSANTTEGQCIEDCAIALIGMTGNIRV